jgi:non-lysosomal glucosylceramidase
MALYVGDTDFANKCVYLFTHGSTWVDANLFNGEYYEQKIIDPTTGQFISSDDVNVPDYQLGKGCLVDQLVGQMMSHVCNLGYLALPANISTTCRSILKYNYLETFSEHFNNMRSFVMGDESGLLMASWPRGRLQFPFPYFSESMTGFEYTAACNMIYENQTEEGVKCIQSIRDRFDGLKRNPFSEPECGHHYGRSMTSWTTLLAWSGFHYSAVTRTIEFGDKPGVFFWSNGYAWGSCRIFKNRMKVYLMVSYGIIEIDYFGIKGKTMKKLAGRVVLSSTSDLKTLEIEFDN